MEKTSAKPKHNLEKEKEKEKDIYINIYKEIVHLKGTTCKGILRSFIKHSPPYRSLPSEGRPPHGTLLFLFFRKMGVYY